MAPKKKLKVTTFIAEPLQEYDVNKFVSYEACKRYLDFVVKKEAIQEKGLHVSMDSVSKPLKNWKWEELVKHHEAAVVPVVRKFYVDMEEHRNF